MTETAQALANLDVWLETMRQPGGYGGPVAHWWQNRFRYAGPGLDWRYEGILTSYRTLFEKTGDLRWRQRLRCAAQDLTSGQLPDGSYRASRFEINPGRRGTPHEAAASLGLLAALPHLENRERAFGVAQRNLDSLIAELWDGEGFNDRPGVAGRVPNKLATLAQALMALADVSGEDRYLRYAQAALEDVLRYQVKGGAWRGAIHQYAPDAKQGDGRFFPFYAARCVPPLHRAYEVFADERYLNAAHETLAFIEKNRDEDGSWPQIIYKGGRRASWPRWIAGAADILLAYRVLGERIPEGAWRRLLRSQSATGAFPTAQGFASQISQRPPRRLPDYRDVIAVVGWNDKVFRLMCEELHSDVPSAAVSEVWQPIMVQGREAMYEETPHRIDIVAAKRPLYRWNKQHVWAHVVHPKLDVR